MGKFIDLTGQKFGRLTVIERAESKNKHTMWKCKCTCGNVAIVDSGNLRSKHSTSCGCFNVETVKEKNTKHGKHGERIYRIWKNMKTRCSCKSVTEYSHYGGKGITVCEEWKNSFEAFYNWSIANGYAENLSIDRIDNEKAYSPDNCRWADIATQANNKSNNRLITYKGKTQTLAQWSKELNINYAKLQARINKYHWDIEKALSTP